jgi:hypothetical protein
MNQGNKKIVCPKCREGELKQEALNVRGSVNMGGKIVNRALGRRFVIKCQSPDCNYERAIP